MYFDLLLALTVKAITQVGERLAFPHALPKSNHGLLSGYLPAAHGEDGTSRVKYNHCELPDAVPTNLATDRQSRCCRTSFPGKAGRGRRQEEACSHPQSRPFNLKLNSFLFFALGKRYGPLLACKQNCVGQVGDGEDSSNNPCEGQTKTSGCHVLTVLEVPG